MAHDRLLSRKVSVELQQNDVSMSVHCTHSDTSGWWLQPLAYKFPFVTNHHIRHIVIKDRLMLIFFVYRSTAIKRQQHSVNLYYAALTLSVTQRWTHLCENSESDECSAYLLIEQEWGSNVVRLRPIRTHDILQRQDTLGKGKLRRPVGGAIYANVIWPGMKWKYAYCV